MRSLNPRTMEKFGPEIPDTDETAVAALLTAAKHAAPIWSATPPTARAQLLRRVAWRLDRRIEDLTLLADSETALGVNRLHGEIRRTTFQLHHLADLISRPDTFAALYDEPYPEPPPAGHPGLCRVLVPLGPVLVFAASNFPFAFSVAGGDTASALASGCPVIVKAHPGHPLLSEALAGEILAAASDVGAPAGVFALAHGVAAGRALCVDPTIRAAAFTGSSEVGRELFDLACGREDPIPFYGELGSLNPIFVTPAGARRTTEIARGYVGSLTLGAGQFCTNPGLLIVPRGDLVKHIEAEASTMAPGVFLSRGIARHYRQRFAHLAAQPGARPLIQPDATGRSELAAPVGLIHMDAGAALTSTTTLRTECFGPAGVIVEYDDEHEALALASQLQGCLVAGVHGDPHEELAAALIERLTRIAGRIVWNEWPTGVAVSIAQHHGGPHPATTNSMYTSVGGHAIDRFLRPVVFQSLPADLLPPVARAQSANPDGTDPRRSSQPAAGRDERAQLTQ